MVQSRRFKLLVGSAVGSLVGILCTSHRWVSIFLAVTTGAMAEIMKLVWNSFKSTFISRSKRKEAVMDEMTLVINRFKLSYDCLLRSNHFRKFHKGEILRYGSTTQVQMVGGEIACWIEQRLDSPFEINKFHCCC